MERDYQEPPPPPPEPPPENPPPEELLLFEKPLLEKLLLEELEELDGLDDIALEAEVIVESIKFPNDKVLNVVYPSYQSGACKAIDSNFLIHLLETPRTYVNGKIS